MRSISLCIVAMLLIVDLYNDRHAAHHQLASEANHDDFDCNAFSQMSFRIVDIVSTPVKRVH
jgi:hypothetical protein